METVLEPEEECRLVQPVVRVEIRSLLGRRGLAQYRRGRVARNELDQQCHERHHSPDHQQREAELPCEIQKLVLHPDAWATVLCPYGWRQCHRSDLSILPYRNPFPASGRRGCAGRGIWRRNR